MGIAGDVQSLWFFDFRRRRPQGQHSDGDEWHESPWLCGYVSHLAHSTPKTAGFQRMVAEVFPRVEVLDEVDALPVKPFQRAAHPLVLLHLVSGRAGSLF